jgi:hypothetical protein
MSKTQYLKIIEQEIHNINKKIDMKILNGEDYRKEALEHKILLKKVRQHSSHRNFFSRLIMALPHFN